MDSEDTEQHAIGLLLKARLVPHHFIRSIKCTDQNKWHKKTACDQQNTQIPPPFFFFPFKPPSISAIALSWSNRSDLPQVSHVLKGLSIKLSNWLKSQGWQKEGVGNRQSRYKVLTHTSFPQRMKQYLSLCIFSLNQPQDLTEILLNDSSAGYLHLPLNFNDASVKANRPSCVDVEQHFSM